MRILGIDIGTTSVKAVELETAFRRVEVREYFEEFVQLNETPIHALGRLIESLSQRPDRVVVKLPSSHVTFRNLMVPTKDKKAIDAAVGFELEDELPFHMEDCIYDYCLLSQSKQGSLVHIEVTLKKYIGSLLDDLSDIQVDPDFVISDLWSFKRLCDQVLTEQQKKMPVAIVHIGFDRTLIYIHWDKKPAVIREIDFGGKNLTEAISQKYNVTFEEAEKAKKDNGFVLSSQMKKEATEDQIEFSEVLSEALTPLYLELRKSNLAAKNELDVGVHHFMLSGGGALLPGLRQSMEDHFSIPTTQFRGLSRINPAGGVTYSDETEAFFSSACGVALAGVQPDKKQSIDFRKLNFEKSRQTQQINLTTLKGPMIGAGAVAFCLLLSLGVQSSVYQSQIEDVDQKLKTGIRSIFPLLGGRAIKTYLAAPDRLKKTIDSELRKQREISNLFSQNRKSPALFLKALSQKIPPRIKVDMTRFLAGAAPQKEEQVELVFLLHSKADLETLTSRLKDLIDQLEATEPVETPSLDGTEKHWKVIFSGKPKESAYES